MLRVGRDAFEVEPIIASSRCTPETVSAHMLYENSDPFLLHEPGGVLDVTASRYLAVDDRVVLVTGSQFHAKPYTMKLEGAAGTGYQTLILVGIQDRKVLAQVDRFVAKMQAFLTQRVQAIVGDAAGDFEISIRPYGWNAVSGEVIGTGASAPRELGLLFVATARTQELATQIAKTCNPWVFHLPLEDDMELPSYAFPFSPAEIERGQVFEFKLNHVVRVDHPVELVRTVMVNVGEPAHA
jgi:hypothetical protein